MANPKDDKKSKDNSVDVSVVDELIKKLPDELNQIKENFDRSLLPLRLLSESTASCEFIESLTIVSKDKKYVNMKMRDMGTASKHSKNPDQVVLTFAKKEYEKVANGCFASYTKAWDLNFVTEGKDCWVVTFPPLTSERRDALAKKAQEYYEHSRSGVSELRQKIRNNIKNIKQEDVRKKQEKITQDIIDKFYKDFEAFLEKQQKRIRSL